MYLFFPMVANHFFKLIKTPRKTRIFITYHTSYHRATPENRSAIGGFGEFASLARVVGVVGVVGVGLCGLVWVCVGLCGFVRVCAGRGG